MRKLTLWMVLLFGSTLSLSVFAGGYNTAYKQIPSFDGVKIAAFVMTPKDQGPGPFPLVVMPSSWGAPDLEYVGQGSVLASQGYVVVSYSSRGLWDSQGLADIAGPATVEDVSALIDWALANTPANPAAIGASGISYGAGTSLLAAQRDPRIKAVAALSGWADLSASLYANQTASKQALSVLIAGGIVTARPSPELTEANRLVLAGDYDGAMHYLAPLAPVRNPATDAAALNSNGTAVLLANAYNDGLFPPGQWVDFYNQLSGPKQLMFSLGDHATAELPGALGLPNEVYTAVRRWFDHHLRGANNGVASELPVRLQSQDGQWRRYANWAGVEAKTETYSLTKPSGWLSPTGSLTASSSTGWDHGIYTGWSTVAESGALLLSGLLQGLQIDTTASIPMISRLDAGVWSGPITWTEKVISGMPKLHVTVKPAQANTSLFVYLYDEDLWGVGRLISYKPYSLRNATPGVAQTLDIRMEARSWELQWGHRLTLVVDTVDDRYAGISPNGRLSFSSPAGNPSTLTVPMQ